MAEYFIKKSSIVFLSLSFLLTAAIVGLLCGLLPRCDIPKLPTPERQVWEEIRLPGSLSPTSYDLRIRTDLTNFIFTGSVMIRAVCLEPGDVILIHSRQLTIVEGRTTLGSDNAASVPGIAKEPWLYPENEFLVIELDSSLEKGGIYMLYIEFEGTLTNDLAGYYRMDYTTVSGEDRHLAGTFFDPVEARKAFPCFDEPAMKATFTITLEYEDGYHGLSNMPRVGDEEDMGNGWKRSTFEESVVMSTYLVCYVVSDFKAKYQTTENGVTFGVWAREDFIDQADYALEKGVQILDYFESVYGGGNTAYPLSKMDMIAYPDFSAGAMENWGLITYLESAFFYEEGVSSESQKQRVCTIIAHELAHQWFGNLVTTAWWDSLWLNEGFASYVEYVGTAEAEPDWAIWDQFILHDLHRAMVPDALVTSRPIITDVETPAEINSMFDRISYQKGASVLRMISYLLGDDTFVKGLRYYLDDLRYSAAVTTDLWYHLQTAADEDGVSLPDQLSLQQLMDPWTLQMGFPVITVTRTYDNTEGIQSTLTQKRFLSDPNATQPEDGKPNSEYEWDIPITYTHAQQAPAVSNYWMLLKEASLQASGNDDDWLLLNVDQRGMFRVNYDTRNWNMIQTQLQSDHEGFSAATRGAIINDVFSLAMAGEVSHELAMGMTTYLRSERDYVPWYAVDRALASIERNIQRKEAYGNYKRYMRGQVTPLYDYIGWEDEGDHLKRLNRGRAISMACHYGNEDCLETSINLFNQWMNDPVENNIQPDVRSTAFCAAIAQGGQDEWYFAYDIFINPSTTSHLKAALLEGLACSQKPWLLSTYLSKLLEDGVIRSNDGVDIMTAVAANPVGLPLAWDFFRANWNFFRTVYGETFFLLDGIIADITVHFNSQFELESVEKFMEDHPDQGTGAQAFTEALATIKGNIQWVDSYYEQVETWVDDAVDVPTLWEDPRLPTSLVPEHYDLLVRTDLTNFVFSGTVAISFACVEKTNIIILHSKQLNITAKATRVTAASGKVLESSEPWTYETHQYLVVELISYLAPGEMYTLYLEFAGELATDNLGYYLSTYTPKSGGQRFLASTFFDPVDARKAFPCFDEPDLKATFTITMQNEPGYHALSNMPKTQEDEILPNNWIQAVFEESVVMSTYLVCYVTSDFVAKFNVTKNNIMFGVWAQEDFINQTYYALEKGADILDYYDNLYGLDIKYPISKMDMIALPDFTAGAMENWGLITYRESALLYEPGVSSESQKQRVCAIVAHELAHQWFGNLVTMKWWDYVWLNEGFASYIEYIGTDAVEETFQIWDKIVIYDVQRAMSSDALVTSRPVVIPVTTSSEINSMFDTISYQKGSSINRMMNYFIGEATFTKGLKKYLRVRQYDTAVNSDLWINLQEAIDEDGVDLNDFTVAEIMATWTEQMGFPVVTVKRRYTGQATITAAASQKRFLSDPESDPTATPYDDLGYVWYIPLTYTTASTANFTSPMTMWMQPTDDEVDIETSGSDSDWLLVNVNERGFYRVNYDETNWKLLSRQLVNNHLALSVTSRSSLLSDAFNLARASEISYDSALDLTSYLTNERDYVPWYTFEGVLGYIDDNLALTVINDTFTMYMRDQVTPMYEYVGWEDEGDHLKRLSRASAVRMACNYGNDNCTATAVDVYAQWMSDPSVINATPDLHTVAFCTAIARGGTVEWEFAFSAYIDANTETALKSILLPAMACSRDPVILERYLNYVLNTTVIRSQDGEDVVTAVAANPAGRYLAWDFFMVNWDYFRATYGNTVFLFDNVIKGVTFYFNTQEKLDEVVQFMEDHPDQGTGARAFIEAVAVIEANIRWMDQHFSEVEEWLNNNVKPAWESVRLPETVAPVSYNLTVHTDLTAFIFNGTENIVIECLQRTNIIILHSKYLNSTDGLTLTPLGGGDAVGITIPPWLYPENQFLVIQLDDLLVPGAMYVLHIEFAGYLLNDLLGYYYSQYTPVAGETRYLASTFFDPVDARKAFPCFDEPAMKATFTITLEYEDRYHGLANMPRVGDEEDMGNGWKRSTFEESVVMSTYLVCYVVSDFKAKFGTTENGVTFGVWAREEYINQTDYALDKGIIILDHFDTLYGSNIEYPINKLDMIALPDFTAGAMENWGLVTYRESALLYEPGVSSESRKERVCSVIAHELAHQWFGNLVTMKWWDYLWLNEGFASYVEYVGTVAAEPDWGFWDEFLVNDLQRSMDTDALVTSRPIIGDVLTPSEINEMFDQITYNKGASILRMLRYFLGESTFTKGLQYYLTAMQYSAAENSDLWYYLEKAIEEDNVDLGDGIDIEMIMRTWMRQNGFPVVMVTRTYRGAASKIIGTATQKRFLADPVSAVNVTSEYPDLGYVWHVPLTYTTRINPNFHAPSQIWLRPEQRSTDIVLEGAGGDEDWLLVNVNEIGFYRVNYDQRNWELLANQLSTLHTALPTTSRSSLLSDAFNLARASEISYESALDLTFYLTEERDYVPWKTISRVLGYIDNNLALTAANDDFKKYMRGRVTPMYEYVGWEEEGDHLKRLSRAGAIQMACFYGNGDCEDTSAEQFAEWMANPTGVTIHPDLEYTVFCTAISIGGSAEWNAAFDAYVETSSTAFLNPLACSRDRDTLNRLLDLSINTTFLRSQDAEDVITAVAANPQGRDLAWDFFDREWDYLRATYGDTVFLFDNIVLGVTSDFNTEAELNMVEEFMATHPDQGTGSQAFIQSLAVINANIRWMDQHYDEVADWLTRNA